MIARRTLLTGTSIAVVAATIGRHFIPPSRAQSKASTALLARVDHLVYASPDLNLGIDGRSCHTGGPASRTWNTKRVACARTLDLPRNYRTRSRTTQARKASSVQDRRPRSTEARDMGSQRNQSRPIGERGRDPGREAGCSGLGESKTYRRGCPLLAVHQSFHGRGRRDRAVLHRLGTDTSSI
jgi:hypothetical protein